MINLDSLTLKAFELENADYFEDARIQKIQQPTRRDLILHLHSAGISQKLYININPNCHHICFLSKETEFRRHITIPQQPPMFCMLLRKYMVGSRIVKVNVPDHERIFEIYFETFSEIGEIIPLCLAIELMGKHSNIILYNYETNIILGCMHNIGAEKSREREMAGGLPYIYPPKKSKYDIKELKIDVLDAQLEINKHNLVEFFSSNYHDVSKAMMEEIVLAGDVKSAFKIISEFKELNPSIDNNYKTFSLFSFDKKDKFFVSSVNEMIDEYYSYHIEQILMRDLKQSLLTIVNKDLRKNNNSYDKQKKQFEKLDKAESYKLKADLLMANLYNLKTGLKSIELDNYLNEEKILIELDELLTPVENANRYYKLYNKAKTASEVAEQLMQKLEQEIEYLQNLVYQIESSETYDDLIEIKEEIKPENKVNKKVVDVVIKEININDYRVFIGKNNKQNDYIFSKVSSPDDIWFHALNSPGAHILVKMTDKSDLDDDTLLKVAKLAKQYSKQSNSLKASIIYTKRKYLKRPPNTNAGYVTYRNEKEIVVE